MMTGNIINIIQGDSTDFLGGVAFTVKINTTLDLTGFKGRFQIAKIIKDFADVSSKSVNIVLTKEDTALLPIGTNYGAFKLYDTTEKCRTILKNITFNVSKIQVENPAEEVEG
ncbi:MAG: hypothetical protein WCY19_04960 [Candidatus Gastranaerophilaceae bacterium]